MSSAAVFASSGALGPRLGGQRLAAPLPRLPERRESKRRRRSRQWGAAQAAWGASEASVGVPPPEPPPADGGGSRGSPITVGLIMGFQAAALIGAVWTGVLARRRRNEMHVLNDKLRAINAELRRQREAQESILSAVGLGAAQDEPLPPGNPFLPGDAGALGAGSDSEAGISGIQAAAALEALQRQRELLQRERSALEAALASPAAAHPTELYGDERMSIARARRQIAQCIRGSKELVRDGRPGECFPLLEQGLQLATETQDVRAERALIRVRARALRECGDPASALRDLHRSLALSQQLEETAGDADTFGEIGDLLTELGDLEAAGRFYDKCIEAIQTESQSALSSTWDV